MHTVAASSELFTLAAAELSSSSSPAPSPPFTSALLSLCQPQSFLSPQGLTIPVSPDLTVSEFPIPTISKSPGLTVPELRVLTVPGSPGPTVTMFPEPALEFPEPAIEFSCAALEFPE